MEALKAYIGDRTGLVFVTRNGKKISVDQLENTFSKAGYAAKLPFSKVHPHMLRASAITYLKQLGYSDSEIMKMSGHASAEMVHAYDKSDKADNPSKKVCLVT
jgi:integrase